MKKSVMKIYRHIRAQAQIVVFMGEDDKTGVSLKFRGGRVLGNTDDSAALRINGGMYQTMDPSIQKAIESRPDYGRAIFAEHELIDEAKKNQKPSKPNDKEFKVFKGSTINAVKNTLKDMFPGIAPSSTGNPQELYTFCESHGLAFPEFFAEHKERFTLPEEEEEMEIPEEMENPEKQENPGIAESDEIILDRDELMAKSRADLNDFALAAGLADPDKLPNKGSVIDELYKLAE